MSMAYWISGIVVGVIFGLGLALRLTAYCVMKSNDYGDTSGSCSDFGEGIFLVVEDDNMKTREFNQNAKEILNKRREDLLERETGSKTRNKTGGATVM